MGTEYFIFDKKNKRLFSLGNGTWDFFDDHVDGVEVPLDEVHRKVVEDWNRFRTSDFTNIEDPVFLLLSQQLWAFCQVAGWQLEVRTDVTDYEDEYVGSGWSEVWTPHPKVRSRYTGVKLDPDPCAEEQEKWEQIAKGGSS
jgi:hypothetical protein